MWSKSIEILNPYKATVQWVIGGRKKHKYTWCLHRLFRRHDIEKER